MSTFLEVLRWAAKLPDWQSDAVRRLLLQTELTKQDHEDVLALLKAEHGISDAAGRSAVRAPAPPERDLTAVVSATPPVKLTAVGTLRNVNALDPSSTLPFAPLGMSVVYGDNGAGKSGYTRVLKKICRARDAEAILPNVADGEVDEPASGAIGIEVDGVAQTLRWTDGEQPPAELEGFAVFDTRCARLYLDQENDFCFQPAGLDVFERLASLCGALKAEIERESDKRRPQPHAFKHLHGETGVGRFLATLSPASAPEEVERLSSWSEEDECRLTQLQSALGVPAPEVKARSLRALAARIERLRSMIGATDALLSDDVVTGARRLVLERAELKRQVDAMPRAARTELSTTAADDAWRVMFDAARAFAGAAHTTTRFDVGEPCLLCAQPLGADAAARLQGFDEFVSHAVTERVSAIAKELQATLEAAQDRALDPHLESDLLEAVREHSAELADAIGGRASLWAERREVLERLVAGTTEPLKVVPLPTCADGLTRLGSALAEESAALDAMADPPARSALVAECAELKARSGFRDVVESVREALAAHVHVNALTKCASAVRTTALSSKVSDITASYLSPQLAKVLNEELVFLGLEDLQVKAVSRTVAGEPRHKLVLAQAVKRKSHEVLSEGQQRALAIAAFFAEVRLSGAREGVVFDDPVSSLDHQRRASVAKRLVAEAASRQVIVFTHDLSFLFTLKEEAERTHAPIATQMIRRRKLYGVPCPDLPFEGRSAAQRAQDLAEKQRLDAALVDDDERYETATSDTYRMLRIAWERAVEEVLLRKVVLRFRHSVSTTALIELSVIDSDAKVVNEAISKCGDQVHDVAAERGRAIPPRPAEVKRDIEALQLWIKDVRMRAQLTKERRAAGLAADESGLLPSLGRRNA